MELYVTNGKLSVREALRDGRKYLVAPVVMIVPGVLNGSGGPLLYPTEEVARNADGWNGMPITVDHPKVAGRHVSGRHPSVSAIGHVYNATVRPSDGSLVAEAWFDLDVAQRVEPRVITRLRSGLPIGLSTGLFTTNVPAPAGSTWKGSKVYTHVAKDYKPDHLAILLDVPGACSLNDGCGVLVNCGAEQLLVGNSTTVDSDEPASVDPVAFSSEDFALGPYDAAELDGLLEILNKAFPSGKLEMTPDKACKIVKDGYANGHKLTKRQRGMFGALCGKASQPTKNANPAGCNQHTGPGCSLAGAKRTKFGRKAIQGKADEQLRLALAADKKGDKDAAKNHRAAAYGYNKAIGHHLDRDRSKRDSALGLADEFATGRRKLASTRNAEATPAALEAFYALILNSAGDDVGHDLDVLTDATGLVVHSNPQGCNQFSGPGCSVGGGHAARGYTDSGFRETSPGSGYKAIETTSDHKPLHPDRVKEAVAKMKVGSKVNVVFTTPKDDRSGGKEMSGTVTGFHKESGGAILEVHSGDLGKGRKLLNPLSSIHSLSFNSAGAAMNPELRNQILTNLTTNCGCGEAKTPWAGKSRADLEAATDAELNAYEAARTAIATANAAASFTDAQGNQHRFDPATGRWNTVPALNPANPPSLPPNPAPTANGQPRTMSPAEWLAMMPQEARPVWNSAVEIHNREKGGIIAQIVGNMAEGQEKTQLVATLSNMDIATLKTLVPAVRPTPTPQVNSQGWPTGPIMPNWFGTAGALGNPTASLDPTVNAGGPVTEQPLTVPTYDFAAANNAAKK